MDLARSLPLLLGWALTALLGTSCRATPPGTSVAPARPARVLLLGDSISMGYTPVVQDLLAGRAFVTRARRPDGVTLENCEGTTHGVQHVDRWLAQEGGAWDVIHFNFGLHDLKRVHPETRRNSDDPSDPRQAELEVYEAQLETIVERLETSGATLVFATTTPVPAGVRPHRDPGDVARYNDAARRVMQSHGVAIDDLCALVQPHLAELQKPHDVHFAPEGSRFLGEAVAKAVLAAHERRPAGP